MLAIEAVQGAVIEVAGLEITKGRSEKELQQGVCACRGSQIRIFCTGFGASAGLGGFARSLPPLWPPLPGGGGRPNLARHRPHPFFDWRHLAQPSLT